METQFIYYFPGQNMVPLPLFPAVLLPKEQEEEPVEEETTDKLELSSIAVKKRSKSGKKKKSGKKDKNPKEDKTFLVTSEEQPKAVESNQQLPEVDHLHTPEA
jgi:hypothetical protein